MENYTLQSARMQIQPMLSPTLLCLARSIESTKMAAFRLITHFTKHYQVLDIYIYVYLFRFRSHLDPFLQRRFDRSGPWVFEIRGPSRAIPTVKRFSFLMLESQPGRKSMRDNRVRTLVGQCTKALRRLPPHQHYKTIKIQCTYTEETEKEKDILNMVVDTHTDMVVVKQRVVVSWEGHCIARTALLRLPFLQNMIISFSLQTIASKGKPFEETVAFVFHSCSSGWINFIDLSSPPPTTSSAQVFLTGLPAPVALIQASDGKQYKNDIIPRLYIICCYRKFVCFRSWNFFHIIEYCCKERKVV